MPLYYEPIIYLALDMIDIPKDYDLRKIEALLKEIERNKTYSGINVDSIIKEGKPGQNIASY